MRTVDELTQEDNQLYLEELERVKQNGLTRKQLVEWMQWDSQTSNVFDLEIMAKKLWTAYNESQHKNNRLAYAYNIACDIAKMPD